MLKPIVEQVNRAQRQIAEGNIMPAIALYQQLRTQQPEESFWVESLAELYRQQQGLDKAIVTIEVALFEVNDHSALLSRLCTYYQAKQQYHHAIAYGHWAVQTDPHNWSYRFNLANSYHMAKAFDEALSVIEGIVNAPADDWHEPIKPAVWRLYGDILTQLECYLEAIEAYQNIQNWNQHPQILNALGTAAYELGHLAEAEACFKQALDLDPGYLIAEYHLGNVWSAQGQDQRAIEQYRQLLNKKPAWPEAQLNLALLLFSHQQLSAGYLHYRARWQIAAYQQDRLKTTLLEWDWARSSLTEDDRLLVWSEQGVGDEIMWLKYYLALQQKHPKTTIALNSRLISLLKRSHPQVCCLERAADLSEAMASQFDYHLPMGDLLGALEVRHIAPQAQYLTADASLITHFKNKYQSQVCIGLSWRGGKGKQQVERSIPIETLKVLRDGLEKENAKRARLGLRPMRWVSVQYGVTDQEREALRAVLGESLILEDEVEPLLDLESFAAQLCALKFVISVDNSTVHLAGALGVETCVVVPEIPEWRWQMNADKRRGLLHEGYSMCPTPWYQSVTAYWKGALSWQKCLENVLKMMLGLSCFP